MAALDEPVGADELADLAADVRGWLQSHRGLGASIPTGEVPARLAVAPPGPAPQEQRRAGAGPQRRSPPERRGPPPDRRGPPPRREGPPPRREGPPPRQGGGGRFADLPLGGPSRGRPPAPAKGVGSPALQAIRTDLGDCTRCKLAPLRTNIVFGVGNPKADIVFVGEGPGYHEDRQGELFVGAAGELLTRIITNVLRLDRSDVYIANVLKCRPPNNRNPEPDEVAACAPFLHRQLDSIEPVVVVALGRFAIQCLLQSTDSVGRLRGRAHPFRGAVLVPTYHPAYLLRNPADKRKTMQDMLLVRSEFARISGRELPPPLSRKPAPS